MENTLLSERIFHSLKDYLYRYRYVILGSLLMGLLAYAYAFTNKLPNHDDVTGLFSKGAGIESGRFGITLLSHLFPNFSMPWIYGVGSLVLLALGNCLIVKMFSIRSPLLQFLLGGIIVTFPSQTAVFSYLFTAFPYAIAYWLAVLSADLISREGKKYILPGVLALMLCVSIYQAYLAITASLLILVLIRRLISEEAAAGTLFARGVVFVCCLAAGVGAYWIISKLLWTYSPTAMNSYAGDSLAFRLSDLPANLKAALINCIRVIRYRHFGLVSSEAAVPVHMALLAFAGVELGLYVLKTRDLLRTLLLGFLAAMLPFAINCLFLIVSADAIHTLVMFPYVTLYVLFAFLVEFGQLRTFARDLGNKLHRAVLNLCVLALAWILAGNVFLANEASLAMHLSYENTYAFAVTSLAQLNTMEAYTPESQVVILGSYPSMPYTSRFRNSMKLMGVGGLSPDMYSMEYFFDYYVGAPVNVISAEEYLKTADPDALSQIPSYPARGCIAQVGDTFVIKLSD